MKSINKSLVLAAHKEEIEKIAASLKNSPEWIPDECRALCEFAGLSDEWEAADGESFESVVYRAADILEVEI